METEELNRFDRIMAIFIHLQSGGIVKAQDLAQRFGVSLRTIYRDIRSLETSGIPIAGEAGVGYSLSKGFFLPPVMFTREEAVGFVAAEKLMKQFTDKKLQSTFESAMFKIKSVLRDNAKEHISALESLVWVNMDQKVFNDQTPNALEILFESIVEKKQVSINYKSLYQNSYTDRIIEPVGLFHENQFWYVMAYCHLRNEYRQFRTDRIWKISRTDLPFTIKHIELEELRKKMHAGNNQEKVVIRVKKEIVRYLVTGRKYYGYVSEVDRGEFVDMTFQSHNQEEGLARWFMMFADCAEILESQRFKERIREISEKILKNLN